MGDCAPARILQALSLVAAGVLLCLLLSAPGAAPQHSTLHTLDATAAPCRAVFEEYRPSELEASWAAHVAALDPAALPTRSFCEDTVSPSFVEPMQAWIAVGAEQNAIRPRTRQGLAQQAAALAARPDVFSRLAFRDSCTGARWEAHVAPLAGMLRDPRAPCARKVFTPLLFDSGRGETLQPKDTVILDGAAVAAAAAALAAARAAGHPRRAILLDAGASTYNGESEGWPGTRWLVERYQDLGCVAKRAGATCLGAPSGSTPPRSPRALCCTCLRACPPFHAPPHCPGFLFSSLNFTDIYAWEFTPRPGFEYFEGMPAELVAATHFYNFGASNLEGPRNPLSILKAAAQPGDFVVFKLDIDTPSVEIPLVEALLKDEGALALITHFYYELHFNLKDMDWAWGHGMEGDLSSATRVFRAFRERGIAAQMWP